MMTNETGTPMAMRAEEKRQEGEHQKLVSQMAAQLVLSVFDESGNATDTLIHKIEHDDRIPLGMRAEVLTAAEAYLNKMVIELAKQLPEGRPLPVIKERDGNVGSESTPAEDQP